MKNLLIGMALIATCFGCASTESLMTDTTKRAPTTNVEILTEKPARPYKSIGMLQFLGAKEDEFKAKKYFRNQAGKLGANAVLMNPDEVFQKWVGFTPTTAVKYTCNLLVYE